MENSFLDIQYIVSYPGVLLLVWLFTQMFKSLFDKLRPDNKTQYLVLGFTIFFVSVVKIYGILVFTGIWTNVAIFILVIEWLVNICIVWVAVMKAHELFIEK